MLPAARPAPAETAPDRLLALADRCVQCGLCLPACPTYGLERSEAESPRGRIALARAWALDAIVPTETADSHLDHCLGCRSCEAVCPAGVQYGDFLLEARNRQRMRRPVGWQQHLAEWLAARPALLTRLLGFYRRVFGLLPAKRRRLPKPVTPSATPLPELTQHKEESVALFTGCVARPYEAGLREAVVRLCALSGIDVRIPVQQTCCGALHAHAGNTRESEHLASVNRSAFADAGTVLTLATGCHEAVGHSLRSSVETVDAIAFVHRLAGKLSFRECNERVALHLPCTQRNVVKSVAATRNLLNRVPGLTVVELTAGHGCCGAAGTQMLLDPARADAYRAPLVEQFERGGTTRLLSANIGCRLHLANAVDKSVQHPLEFLAGLT
jgi:glycolate oxidase iron-sulfur subunit